MVQLLNAGLNQIAHSLARQLQFCTHQLLGHMQGQAFEGLKKPLRVLVDAAQLDAQMADQLTLFCAFGVVFRPQLVLAFDETVLEGLVAHLRQGRLAPGAVHWAVLRRCGLIYLGGLVIAWRRIGLGSMQQALGRLGFGRDAPGPKGLG